MIVIRLHNHSDLNLVGKIIGFDEFMNLVIDNAYELNYLVEKKFIGRLLVKADCIVTIFEYSEDYFDTNKKKFIK